MRRIGLRLLLAAAFLAAPAGPVLAHGDHDARPLARSLRAGQHTVSLWQVYADAGVAMAPHLIVVFDGVATAPPAVDVAVEVNGMSIPIARSMTTANGWETTLGLADGDVVSVTVSEGDQAWRLEPVAVPGAPTSVLPMRELILVSIVLTAVAALWAASRATRVWRRTGVTSA